MFCADQPFVLLDDVRACDAAPARLYRDPVGVIRADRLEELEACFEALSRARLAGQHVAGYLSYEAGLGLEERLRGKMPAGLPAPLAWFGIFNDYKELSPDEVAEALPDRNGAWLGRLEPLVSREAYDAAFKSVQNYINNGDIYQANLTFRAEMDFSGHPLALYAAIRGRALAGYGGVVFDGENWMLSFSPELFFALKDGRITARPMKGTAARVADPEADAKVQAQLQSDPKQRAENLMIVDLLRNDLSRVARQGSVKVPELFHIESYPTIHQMTSTITAQLQDGLDAVDVIRQIFPCGSITGAPKIRAMEIIDELELAPSGSGPRGIYCGSIGRIDAPDEKGRSDAAFNVAIRTFFLKSGKETLSIGLGSGIVADSNGEDEWRECLAKGRFAKVDANGDGSAGGNAGATTGANTGGGHRVDLIETMAFDPASGIARLEAHLERMKTSASTLQFEFDRHAARNAIQAITFHQDTPAMVRLHLGQSGALAIELKPMPAPQDGPVKCQLVPMQAEPQDFRLHHKTSDRRVYQVASEDGGLGEGVHPIFVDAEGYVTEGAIWNVFVERDGKLLTPPLARGVLPGVLRAELIESGQAVEADLREEDLAGGFLVGNSVRGLVQGEVG